jgi:hypothetical protein
MSEEEVLQAAVEPVAAYVALKARIAGLEAQADDAKAAVIEALRPDGAAPGKVWTFPGLATVAVVKGRVSERLDRAVLARAGVAAEVLDAATVRTEGAPTLRISAERAEDTRRAVGVGG